MEGEDLLRQSGDPEVDEAVVYFGDQEDLGDDR